MDTATDAQMGAHRSPRRRDEHAALFVCQCEQRAVRGSGCCLARRMDIVTQAGQQRVHSAGRGTDVEEKFHEACRIGTRS